ncbi:hypothetical protein TNCV_203291 [Trichonephila clavipes]|nr:hypothetical protein TNCV_203291 [Trichonephila clavipes]
MDVCEVILLFFAMCASRLLLRSVPVLFFVVHGTTRREDRRIMRQALVDPTVTRSTIRADVAIVPQTISRHQILNPSALSVHSL